MVQDQVGEEAAVLVSLGGVMSELETIPLEVLPEQLGGQGMVLCPILGTPIRAVKGPSDRIGRFRVVQPHDLSRGARGI